MDAQSSRIIAIMGATATGKSSLAIDLATRFAGEIVSMDSRQVYRGMDIGTGKVTAAERARVPHHLIDVTDPLTPWSTGRHVAAARRIVLDIATAGNVPFLVGGTGLYFRAYFDGLVEVRIDSDALADIRRSFEGRDTADLHAELAARDPERARQLSPNDRVRVTRALELIIHTGLPATTLYARQARSRLRDDVLIVVLTMPRHLLRERVAARTRGLFAAGWPDEVRRLLSAGVGADAPGMRSLGYPEIAEALFAGEDPHGCLDAVIKRTQQYAKRQETFFRSVSGARWVDVAEPACADTVSRMVSEFLSRRGE